ncbi:hypothetical protein LPC08_13285 [Roseomonas sp. OT10]|uniref:hypothetical protein n=1 Tax=Roseomonas cutis TaxID=2897332 RepID=UPI001E3F83A6|nr:hypothetical protein [Roseomonas sp. OT10]UFN47001.1 hypothetical protein LPC08_13285 [Roseomonas sp. OT10]
MMPPRGTGPGRARALGRGAPWLGLFGLLALLPGCMPPAEPYPTGQYQRPYDPPASPQVPYQRPYVPPFGQFGAMLETG